MPTTRYPQPNDSYECPEEPIRLTEMSVCTQTGDLRHQINRLLLISAEQQSGSAGVRPGAIALADAFRRSDQRAEVAEIVRDCARRFRLVARQIEFLNARRP